MRLRIRAVQLRVITPSVTCGADIAFGDGLAVLRADNSSGKSTVVQSIIYALGLEGMLSASHDVPLPHVMTDSSEVGAEKLPVTESMVAVEIENGTGRVATVFRGIKGRRNKNLISVAEEAVLTEKRSTATRSDFYVRQAGAAVNERGFHHWFAEFVQWELPKVARVDGTECPLYVECLFPLMIIEQKRGWSAIQARMPFHYRIRDVQRKAVEFLLALDVYELALRRQKLREEAFAIRDEWARELSRVADLARGINGVVQNLNVSTPTVWKEGEAPAILIARVRDWLSFSDALRQDLDELAQLEQREIPRVERVAQELETALDTAASELAEADLAADELFHEVEHEERQSGNLNERLSALEEDERRNRDLVKLARLGSIEAMAASNGHCPTCHQTVSDALLPQAERQEPMTVEQNLKFIRSQIETFSTIREASINSLTAKKRRLESLRQRAAEIRESIRSLRRTLVSEGNEPSIEAIERRLRLRDKVNVARRTEEDISGRLADLRSIAARWKTNQAALADLPKGDLSEKDREKLERLRDIFVSELQQFGMTSVDPTTLRISMENYRPEHDGFDLEFDISASDMIRTIWAYLHGFLELSYNRPTNHLKLLILDEPKQQETARVSFGELFRRAAGSPDHPHQVIIATSEDEATLKGLLDGIPHNYISFPGRILKPLTSTDEAAGGQGPDTGPDTSDENGGDEAEIMPWEEEARSAVRRALESMDFDAEARMITLVGFNDEPLSATSREELDRLLISVAAEAWVAYVPFDSGEPVFEADEWAIVEDVLGPYEDRIEEFFAKADNESVEDDDVEDV